MLSPLETGTTLGATPGTWEEPGNLIPRTDAWHRRTARGASKARQLAGPGASMPVQGLPSHTWGALPDSARQERLLPGPARRQPPECQPR
jgi:hypothetical protein